MKLFILTDLEGAAGVERWDQTYADGAHKPEAMRQLTREVNAAVEGLLEVDPQAQIEVLDGHGSGGLNPEEMHPRAVYLRGWRPHAELHRGYDALLFVGQHAMAGTYHAPLAHTYSSRTVAYYRLNGVFIGEFGAIAAMAGNAGVPTVYLSGDDKALLEAKMWVPEIHGAVTKLGRGLNKAEHLSSEESCALIRRTAAEAVQRIGEVPPLTLEGPYELEVRYLEPQEWETRHWREGVEATVLDARTVLLKADQLTSLPV